MGVFFRGIQGHSAGGGSLVLNLGRTLSLLLSGSLCMKTAFLPIHALPVLGRCGHLLQPQGPLLLPGDSLAPPLLPGGSEGPAHLECLHLPSHRAVSPPLSPSCTVTCRPPRVPSPPLSSQKISPQALDCFQMFFMQSNLGNQQGLRKIANITGKLQNCKMSLEGPGETVLGHHNI